MPVTSADLWKLLGQSRLLSAQRMQQVRGAFEAAGSPPEQVPAKALAQWLVHRQLLTRYQAKVLLSGRAGPFRYGDYQIQDRIHGGRLGRTFPALHLPSHYGVLLKFTDRRIAQDPRQWSVARKFIRAVSPIAHDQLQRVFALEDQAGSRFLVLERLDGNSLAGHLRSDGPLSVTEACRVVRLAALGLAALHAHRHMHGDIRPANTWLEPCGNVKVLRDHPLPPVVPALWQSDVSLSQAAQADYMAPELADPGTPLSPATEIYALGCMLYELLQGRVPFAGRDLADTLRQHATGALPDFDVQSVPPELVRLLEALLAKEPSARPTGVMEVASALLPFIESSQQLVPTVAPSATLLAFQEALGHRQVPAPPAPPPVIPAPDDHPPLPEPPVQPSGAPPPHMTQVIEPLADEPVDTQPQAAAARAIDVVAQPRRVRSLDRSRRRRRSRRKQAIMLSLLAVASLLVTGAVITLHPRVRESLFGPANVDVAAQGSNRPAVTAKNVGIAADAAAAKLAGPAQAGYEVRDDDGQLLWMTPTNGAPLELRFVAPGAQFLLIARPNDLLRSANGPRVLQALGPDFEAARKTWEAVAGCTLEQITQLVVCLHATGTSPSVSVVVQLERPQTTDQLLAAWKNPAPQEYGGQRYYRSSNWAYFIPEEESTTRFVMGAEALIQDVIDLKVAGPILRRELARLLQCSDRDRHLSLLFAPDFLAQDGMLDGTRVVDPHRVQEATYWLLGDDTKACLLSMQFDDPFYVEMRAYGQVNLDSQTVADALRDRIGQAPDGIESVFEQIYPSRYWRRIALRFPEMIRFLHNYTRVGVEDGQAVVNAVLPGQAAHNLVFGAVMLLSNGGTAAVGGIDPSTIGTPPAPADTPQTIEELLERQMDLRFDQKSLEFAIEDLAGDIREAYPRLPFPFTIQIQGADLQLNSITRNQQITKFAVQSRTIAEILTAIVQRANPVATVTDPAALDQKLIWVVGPDPKEPANRILLITTRDAAQREGYKLPSPFQPH